MQIPTRLLRAALGLAVTASLLVVGSPPARADRCEPDELPFRAVATYVLPFTDPWFPEEPPPPLDQAPDQWRITQDAYQFAATQIRTYEGGAPNGEPDQLCHLLFDNLYSVLCPNTSFAQDDPATPQNEATGTLLGCMGEFIDIVYTTALLPDLVFDFICDSLETGDNPPPDCRDAFRRAINPVRYPIGPGGT